MSLLALRGRALSVRNSWPFPWPWSEDNVEDEDGLVREPGRAQPTILRSAVTVRWWLQDFSFRTGRGGWMGADAPGVHPPPRRSASVRKKKGKRQGKEREKKGKRKGKERGAIPARACIMRGKIPKKPSNFDCAHAGLGERSWEVDGFVHDLPTPSMGADAPGVKASTRKDCVGTQFVAVPVAVERG